MRTLVVEPDKELSARIARACHGQSMIVDETPSGEEAEALVDAYEIDAVICAGVTEDGDCVELIKAIRAAKKNASIIVLSDDGDPARIRRVLSVGADDYLRKPFDTRELVARVHAVTRRRRGFDRQILECGDLTIDMSCQRTCYKGHAFHLRRREYQLFEALMLRKGRTVAYETLFDLLFGGLEEPSSKLIDVHLSLTRARIRKVSGGLNFIFTDWGQGLRLEDHPVPLYQIGWARQRMAAE